MRREQDSRHSHKHPAQPFREAGAELDRVGAELRATIDRLNDFAFRVRSSPVLPIKSAADKSMHAATLAGRDLWDTLATFRHELSLMELAAGASTKGPRQ